MEMQGIVKNGNLISQGEWFGGNRTKRYESWYSKFQ